MECRLFYTVLVIYLLNSSGNCREPHCTKFAYEEQLLEKMVRMEFNVERMSTWMKETQKETENLMISVNHELELLQKEKAEWKLEIETSKQDNEDLIRCLTGTLFLFTVITKTYLYNYDPTKPHFYIVKLGFTGVYIIFLISAQKHRLWVLVRTASPRRF